MVLCRLILAAAITMPVSYRYLKQKNTLTKKLIVQIIALGLLTYPITYLLQISGLKLMPAVNAVTIIGMEPIIIVLVGLFFFVKKRLFWCLRWEL